MLLASGGVPPRAAAAADPAPSKSVVLIPDQIELGALVLMTADALGLTVELDPALLRAAGGHGTSQSAK